MKNYGDAAGASPSFCIKPENVPWASFPFLDSLFADDISQSFYFSVLTFIVHAQTFVAFLGLRPVVRH